MNGEGRIREKDSARVGGLTCAKEEHTTLDLLVVRDEAEFGQVHQSTDAARQERKEESSMLRKHERCSFRQHDLSKEDDPESSSGNSSLSEMEGKKLARFRRREMKLRQAEIDQEEELREKRRQEMFEREFAEMEAALEEKKDREAHLGPDELSDREGMCGSELVISIEPLLALLEGRETSSVVAALQEYEQKVRELLKGYEGRELRERSEESINFQRHPVAGSVLTEAVRQYPEEETVEWSSSFEEDEGDEDAQDRQEEFRDYLERGGYSSWGEESDLDYGPTDGSLLDLEDSRLYSFSGTFEGMDVYASYRGGSPQLIQRSQKNGRRVEEREEFSPQGKGQVEPRIAFSKRKGDPFVFPDRVDTITSI